MPNYQLSASDVLEITGLSPKELRTLVNNDCVTPVGGGRSGRHHRFTMRQTFGLLVVKRLRGTWRGCGTDAARDVVAAFESTPDEWLEKQFAEGDTHFVMLHQGKPLMRPKDYDWIDVRWCRDHVRRKVHQLSKRLSVGTGRNRGLAFAEENNK